MDRAKGLIAFAGKGTDFKNLLTGFVHTTLSHCSVEQKSFQGYNFI